MRSLVSINQQQEDEWTGTFPHGYNHHSPVPVSERHWDVHSEQGFVSLP